MRTEKAWEIIGEIENKRSQIKAEWADRLKKAEEEISHFEGEKEKAAEQKNVDAEIEALEKMEIAVKKKNIIQARMNQALQEIHFDIDESILSNIAKEYNAELNELKRKHCQARKELFDLSRKGYILQQSFIEVKNALNAAKTGDRKDFDNTDFLLPDCADELTKEYREAVDPVLKESVWHYGEWKWIELVKKIRSGEYTN